MKILLVDDILLSLHCQIDDIRLQYVTSLVLTI